MPIRHARRPAHCRNHSGQRLSETVFQLMRSHYDQSTKEVKYSPYFTVVRPRQKLRICNNGAMSTSVYAVVDIETTGLDRIDDRIIEIAIVHLDSNLREISRWQSLINPGRPSGAEHIHGLTDAHLVNAPTFSDIADDLARQLHGHRIVAHNAKFDREFLNNEFARAGRDEHIDADVCVCTMDQSRIYLEPGSHSLRGVAERMDIAITEEHRGMSDAVTCVAIFRKFVSYEDSGRRYVPAAINRDDDEVLPAQWKRARLWGASNG